MGWYVPDTGSLSYALTQRGQKPVLHKSFVLDGMEPEVSSLGGVETGKVMEAKFFG